MPALRFAKKHASLVQRYVPSSFDRLRHAKDGVPTCRACETSFKHWPGLMSHLLSGACPEPSKLAAIDADSQAEPLAEPLARLKQTIGNSARFQLPVVAKSVDSQALTSQCLQCGFWTPDYTKLKSHQRRRLSEARVRCGTETSASARSLPGVWADIPEPKAAAQTSLAPSRVATDLMDRTSLSRGELREAVATSQALLEAIQDVIRDD